MISFIDNSIMQIDRALRTVSPKASTASRPSPADKHKEAALTPEDHKHVTGLMRINHTGEVCAQALYAGQALTAKLDRIRLEMEQAAEEEVDHLVWCEQRLLELNCQPSLLNPLFYSASFLIGAGAGLISDRLSLGFVAATEDQVCIHLDKHLDALPEADLRSQAILKQMRIDEAQHKEMALKSGGYTFPPAVMNLMTQISKIMTMTTYRV
ncbi:2-polyprenyl-3-methyl-6-methoxy-1,4-benzoquinone monooxygenase [Marinomonas sp. 15G1-11]|uniref:3-demethoxyubiquinol 3-hydroxylase n=1 Tax=Marinomonas phaeophyticola TaxID=3004091 RepID=A0ABT4JX09_9GAMM|nr:2-polyprenyl-3-methyl-6-methoxy-1,4-benzoquinone monooxygenase [Marinomonas sp. 15G1-11]MCZ2722854.1 2-polyprenyl-3-methyl-6-methoxy-1,4-benzoquinone monooxygenase [Marinomonas sp. 15G1-11]